MQTVYKASEVSREERRVVERLLGRALGEHEIFQLSAPVANILREAASGPERERVYEELLEHLRFMNSRTKPIPMEHLDWIVADEIDAVRQERQ